MRGEYNPLIASRDSCEELPPRARRIHRACEESKVLPGTTSACAENTINQLTRDAAAGNYLRVRGEYLVRKARLLLIRELPPRARRIH